MHRVLCARRELFGARKSDGWFGLRQLRHRLYEHGFEFVGWIVRWAMSERNRPMHEAKQVCGRAKPSVWTWVLTWSFLALGAGVFASGCGVSAEQICNVKCSCEGCNQAELDDCVSDVNATVQKAQNLGCSSQYADWLSCVEEEAECRNGDTFAWDGCDIEEDALSACGGYDACTQAAEKMCNECGVGCGDPPPSGCSGRTECLSKCTIAATCDEIFNSTGTFASCSAGCP